MERRTRSEHFSSVVLSITDNLLHRSEPPALFERRPAEHAVRSVLPTSENLTNYGLMLCNKTASFAVGTRVTSRPPPRSVRAAFPHTAPTSGNDASTLSYASQHRVTLIRH